MERGESKMRDSNVWPLHLFQGNATAYIKDKALAFCKGDGIDFGAGKWCLPGAIPVDHTTYFTLEDFDPASLDFVYSSHCLEHIAKWQKVLEKLVFRLKPNGIIFLYLPHKISPWTGWRKHKWTPTVHVIATAFSEMGIIMVEFDSKPDEYQSFFVVGRKKVPEAHDPLKPHTAELYKICIHCKHRYDAAENICPQCGGGKYLRIGEREGHET